MAAKGMQRPTSKSRSKSKSGEARTHWGYIEGYYWRLMNWEERTLLVEHLGRLGGNRYLYAPKEDPLHRREWRVPYGKKWLSDWSTFAAKASLAGVEAIPGLAPGLSYDYLNPQDYRILLRKLKVFRDAGCAYLALLMDDIPAQLPMNCRDKFSTLGEAHGKLLTALLADLNRDGRSCRLWFCPTVYTDQFAQAGLAARDPYLLDLARTMPPEVTVMWTGPGIISKTLTAGSIRPLAKLFGGNVVIWDNLYANDYCPHKLFIGPYRGRSKGIWQLTRGVLLNPTGMPITDMFLMKLVADHKAGLAIETSWRRALTSFGVPEGFRKISKFLDSPFRTIGSAEISPRKVEGLRKALHPLIWDWVSPLHREWATFLFMLDADLKVGLKGKASPDPAWIRKRYSPLLAKLLLTL